MVSLEAGHFVACRDCVLKPGDEPTDPFSFPVDLFFQQLNEQHPRLRAMGGMASGGRGPGECRLIGSDAVHEQGAVGVQSLGLGRGVDPFPRELGDMLGAGWARYPIGSGGRGYKKSRGTTPCAAEN